jgi:hypothetical protein
MNEIRMEDSAVSFANHSIGSHSSLNTTIESALN